MSDEEDSMVAGLVGTGMAIAKESGSGLISKAFGPLADEFGQHLADRYRLHLQAVVERAERRLRSQTDATDIPTADVSLRVAGAVFEAAFLADSPIVTEYLSGVLANSAVAPARGDRGVGWTAMIGRLSTDQIRLHFAFYKLVREMLLVKELTEDQICRTVFFVPYSSLMPIMNWVGEDDPGFIDAFFGLLREDLVSRSRFAYGTVESLSRNQGPGVIWPESGLTFAPSRAGLLLFLWGVGLGGNHPTEVIAPSLHLHLSSELKEVQIAGELVVNLGRTP